jgi:hypothetical protein
MKRSRLDLGLIAAITCTAALLAACGSDGGGEGGESTGNAQTPPQGETAVEAWLTKGDYKSWKCETAVHDARSPSPHGFNRICVNDALAAEASGTGNWPKGAAAVKELYDAADGPIVGYAVELKMADDSGGGAGWYWYERTAGGVVADGVGDSGAAKTICVGCHTGAGSDAAHTPSPGGRDFVYTPVQ